MGGKTNNTKVTMTTHAKFHCDETLLWLVVALESAETSSLSRPLLASHSALWQPPPGMEPIAFTNMATWWARWVNACGHVDGDTWQRSIAISTCILSTLASCPHWRLLQPLDLVNVPNRGHPPNSHSLSVTASAPGVRHVGCRIMTQNTGHLQAEQRKFGTPCQWCHLKPHCWPPEANRKRHAIISSGTPLGIPSVNGIFVENGHPRV